MPEQPAASIRKITAEDPLARSADVVADNIATLKAMFPELVTEGANGASVNIDVLKQLVGDRTMTDAEEKFGLNWHGKRRARQMALTPSTGTLRPCPDESVDWDTTQNLFIEGDNLEVLKLLQKSYSGSGPNGVKLIYIDPPYNTGSDLVYSDDFSDSVGNYQMLTGQRASDGRRLTTNSSASGRFHTNWLNMIYPRLLLARQLLTLEGVMLISIDDHEFNHLRSVCDDVFGVENLVATLVWEKGRKNDARLVSVGHEYILVYARSLSALRDQHTTWREAKPGVREIWTEYVRLRKELKADDSAIEIALQEWYKGLPKSHPSRKWTRYKHIDRHGPWRDDNISWPGGGGPRYDVIHPKTKQPCKVPERGWVFASVETMQKMIDIGVVTFRDDHTEPPIRKSHMRPIAFELLDEAEMVPDAEVGETGESTEDELATQVRGSYFYKQSQVSVKYLRKLLGAKIFDNPKDHIELARLVDYFTGGDKAATVLDFFAGSGSTAEAVFDLNSNDGGSRRVILVQLPEPLDPADKDQKAAAEFCDKIGKPRNIAELSKERLRLSGKRIRSAHAGDTDLGFRVCKLDTSSVREWNPDRNALSQELSNAVSHIIAGRANTDLITELLLKRGLDLCVPVATKTLAGKSVHSVGAGSLIACLDKQITRDDGEALALGIAAWHKEINPAGETAVIFRDDAFSDDVVKTNVAAILEQHGLKNVRSL
jgi:adenine-specific DNA-methyltransferase